MHLLTKTEYHIAQPLFEACADIHLSVAAVLAAAAPGDIWVDDLQQPNIALLDGPESWYLAGNPDDAVDLPSLGRLIPPTAYLIYTPDHWETHFPALLSNQFARRHERIAARQTLVPDDKPVITDARYRLLELQASGPHHLSATDRDLLDDWFASNRDSDLATAVASNAGHAMLAADAVVALCLSDVIAGDRGELGVWVAPEYRRQGLARQVVQATLALLAARGVTSVGWHCLANNRESRALALATGFVEVASYRAFSASLPAESAKAMSPDEFGDWAVHYERGRDIDPWFSLLAAEAWALAGRSDAAFANLQHLIGNGDEWAEQLPQRWRLASLHPDPRFPELIAALQRQTHG
ncbi:GNAT family N-acetyltransferase [Jeongeupia naejangsanensis]|uniref:GNAT family N-acetyltransferase n=1 Tax=Jeongeupia naejangsanensis TaxID=613195 RepID=A0ABS2BKU3_9NEIS|nr:GNAT family N-acetyltransferase [Jeongeupia naejangsanensis]MBM3115596.1 GNAT family N-acetyltransferase [Jeongeupia naejangsanensis]